MMKVTILQILSIEGIPFIIRFKTVPNSSPLDRNYCIEGIPFIIRFKTPQTIISRQ